MTFEECILQYINKAKTDKKVFETKKIEFKENYQLFNSTGTQIKAVRAEIVKDVLSLANSMPDPEEETGVLIIGIKENGDIVENYKMPVKDAADWAALINSLLERPIDFHYREHIFDNLKFGVLIIPKSMSKPHIIRCNYCDDNGHVLLREGECWTRTGGGGKKVALASDYDEIYKDTSQAYTAGILKHREKLEKRTSKKKKRQTKKQVLVQSIYAMDLDKLNKLSRRILK